MSSGDWPGLAVGPAGHSSSVSGWDWDGVKPNMREATTPTTTRTGGRAQQPTSPTTTSPSPLLSSVSSQSPLCASSVQWSKQSSKKKSITSFGFCYEIVKLVCFPNTRGCCKAHKLSKPVVLSKPDRRRWNTAEKVIFLYHLSIGVEWYVKVKPNEAKATIYNVSSSKRDATDLIHVYIFVYNLLGKRGLTLHEEYSYLLWF